MTPSTACSERSPRRRDPSESRARHLVVLPAFQALVAAVALLSSETLGPSHPVTAALGIGVLYGTVLTGPLALVGLWLDGRRTRGRGTATDAPRWHRYAAAALGLAAVLAYHLTLGDALGGALEPGVSLALAMVPVGLAYRYRRRVGRR